MVALESHFQRSPAAHLRSLATIPTHQSQNFTGHYVSVLTGFVYRSTPALTASGKDSVVARETGVSSVSVRPARERPESCPARAHGRLKGLSLSPLPPAGRCRISPS